MLLGPHEFPWTVLAGEFSFGFVVPIMVAQAGFEVGGLADVEFAEWVLQDVREELFHTRAASNGSSGRICRYYLPIYEALIHVASRENKQNSGVLGHY